MIDFSETLPVGMVAHGGQVAQAMALAAKKIQNTSNWEAFHYERISENSFELTGGIVSISNGGKRWLEPHDSVIVSLAQITQAYLTLYPEETRQTQKPSATPFAVRCCDDKKLYSFNGSRTCDYFDYAC